MTDRAEHAAIWPEASTLDRAMDAAFLDAVRRHRAANVPLVMWEDGEVRHVSPFEIPLPGEEQPGGDKRRAMGAD